MALVAIGVRQLIVVVRVTGLAAHGKMSSREWKLGCRMIKRRGLPRRGCMTLRAGLRESRRDVVGIRSLAEIAAVTRIATCRQVCVLVVLVTIRAGHGQMRPGERELRRGMIERRGLPRSRAMTLCTILGKLSSHMVRVCRLIEIRQMT